MTTFTISKPQKAPAAISCLWSSHLRMPCRRLRRRSSYFTRSRLGEKPTSSSPTESEKLMLKDLKVVQTLQLKMVGAYLLTKTWIQPSDTTNNQNQIRPICFLPCDSFRASSRVHMWQNLRAPKIRHKFRTGKRCNGHLLLFLVIFRRGKRNESLRVEYWGVLHVKSLTTLHIL